MLDPVAAVAAGRAGTDRPRVSRRRSWSSPGVSRRRHGDDRVADPAACRPARPRRASPARPGRRSRCRPDRRRRAGSTPCGPSVAPASRSTVSMLHDPVMEQVGLEHAAAVDRARRRPAHQVGLGQPVGLAPDAAPDPGAQRCAARGSAPAVPAAARANHGAASISTKVSTTSLRQTNELHSGCSPTRSRPTSSPLRRGRRPRRRRRPAASSTTPPQQRRQPRSRALRSAPREPTSDAEPDRGGHDQRGTAGTARSAPRATLSRAGGAKVRLWSPASAAAAQLHRRAAQPGRALLRPSPAPPTAPRPGRSSAPPARARPCRSCRGTRACRRSAGSIRSQPPPSS